MKNKLVFLFLLVTIIKTINAQNEQELINEYNELCKNLLLYGPTPTLPYYNDVKLYSTPVPPLRVDVENELSFGIIDAGYIKFMKPDGKIYFSRLAVLRKEGEKYFKDLDECVEVLQPTEIDDLFETIVYLPENGADIKIIDPFSLEISDVVPQIGMIQSKKLNISSIEPIYVISRMLEIINILRKTKHDFESLYDFKEKILTKMLDIELQGSLRALKNYKLFLMGNKKITPNDFWEINDYYGLILELRKFIAL
jgi:hypothetical protein